jgi:hypothetical protein
MKWFNRSLFPLMILLALINLILVAGCTNPLAKQPTYLELMAHAKYKVGQKLTLTEGFYKGCEATITEITTTFSSSPELEYIATTPCVNDAQRIRVSE